MPFILAAGPWFARVHLLLADPDDEDERRRLRQEAVATRAQVHSPVS
jgi:hypothetical protein